MHPLKIIKNKQINKYLSCWTLRNRAVETIRVLIAVVPLAFSTHRKSALCRSLLTDRLNELISIKHAKL